MQAQSAAVMADAQRVSAVDVDHLPFVTLLYARRLPSSIEGMEMEDQMRAAFETWAARDLLSCDMCWSGDYEDARTQTAWEAWQAATAECSDRHNQQLTRLRDSLTRLLKIDKQLQDLLPSTKVG